MKDKHQEWVQMCQVALASITFVTPRDLVAALVLNSCVDAD